MMNLLPVFRPVYQPLFGQQRTHQSGVIKDTVTAIAVSAFALMGAQFLQHQAPEFSAVLCIVPCIAAVIWLLRRSASSFSQNAGRSHYSPNRSTSPIRMHQPPVYGVQSRMQMPVFSPGSTSFPGFQNMYPLQSRRGFQREMHAFPPNRFPDIVRVSAYQANQMDPNHRSHL